MEPKAIYSALLGAVRAAATHLGHVEEIAGHGSPRVIEALDAIETACSRGVPEVELAKNLVRDLQAAVRHDGTLEGMKELLR